MAADVLDHRVRVDEVGGGQVGIGIAGVGVQRSHPRLLDLLVEDVDQDHLARPHRGAVPGAGIAAEVEHGQLGDIRKRRRELMPALLPGAGAERVGVVGANDPARQGLSKIGHGGEE